jgi:hypothetical protein
MNAYLQIGSMLSILKENQIRTFFSDSTKQIRAIRVLCIRVQKKSDSPSKKHFPPTKKNREKTQ